MASPQKENGFTPIANEILEACLSAKFNGTQFKIIIALWRFTYGFKRKDHDFSLTFLSNALGIHKQTVKRELDKLIEQNVILVTSNSDFTTSRKLAFNKDYEQWGIQSTESQTVSGLAYPTVSELTDTTVSRLAYQERNIKENIKENISSSNDVSEIIQFWDQNGFGYNNINAKNDLLSYLDDGYSKDMVLEALKIACNKNARHINFVKGVFRNWIDKGIRTIEQIKELDNKKPTKKRSIFDQGEESKKRQAEIKSLTVEEQEQMKKWEEELPY